MSEPRLSEPPPIPKLRRHKSDPAKKVGQALALRIVEQDINNFGAKRKRGNPAWVKGVSGNPNGRSKTAFEVWRLAREAAPESMRQLIELAHHPETEMRAKLFALDKVLQHAHLGKPPAEAPQRPDLSSLSTKELETLGKILGKAAKAGAFPGVTTIEGEQQHE